MAQASSSLGTSSSSGTGCVMTFTGAVNDTQPCSLVNGSYDMGNGKGGIPITSLATVQSAPVGSFALTVTGDLQMTTYNFGTTSVENLGGSYSALILQEKAWVASKADDQGAVSLTVTSLEVTGTLPNGSKTYRVHGSLDATLAGTAQAAGTTVTAHVTF